MLFDGPTLNVLSLEGLRLPRRRLGVIGRRRLVLGWLERVCERISLEIGILPGRSGMVYDTRSLFFLPLFLKDSFEPFLVWAIV
jgi:hypothetical protein